jgi:hypothetical protein
VEFQSRSKKLSATKTPFYVFYVEKPIHPILFGRGLLDFIS